MEAMTPLSAERVEKLSRIVEGMRVAMPAVNSQEVFNDLLAILSSHEKMRAENEGLREQHKTDEGVNLRLCEMHTNQQKELHNLGKAYKKAEAELAKQAPLIQAVMGATPWGGMNPLQLEFYPDDAKNILRAAIAYREVEK
jgi:hypothetical protein